MKFFYKPGIIGLLLITLLLSACGSASDNVPPDNRAAGSVETNISDIETPAVDSQQSTNAQQPVTEQDAVSSSFMPPDSEFVVYYLDVGQGAAAFIVCDGETMLIDGGDPSSSNLIYSFLDRHGIDHLDYILNSHPHDDHIGGLSGALNYVSSVGMAFVSHVQHDIRAVDSFHKYLGDHGVEITVPNAGETFKLGSATVTMLAPLKDYNGINNNSIVLKITYGETSFLFKGDAERESEIDILEAGFDLSATVLKVSHHGSETSTTYPFLREVMPEIAVISCGANNRYGHPHEDTLSRLRDADVKVYRTDMQGDIIIRSDGYKVYVETGRNADIQTNPTAHTGISGHDELIITGDEEHYIGNANSKKLHRPDCRTLPDEKNRVIFDILQEGLDAGHDPCGNCKPHG